MLSCSEYYCEYYFYTSVNIVEYTIWDREAELHSVDGPRQLGLPHPFNPFRHQGCPGAAWKGRAPPVNAQDNAHSRLGLLHTIMGSR